MSHQVVFYPSYHHMALLVFSNCLEINFFMKFLQEKDIKAAWWRPGPCNGVTAFPWTITKWLTVLLPRAHDVLNILCSLRHILKIVKHHLSQNLNIFLYLLLRQIFLKLLYHLVLLFHDKNIKLSKDVCLQRFIWIIACSHRSLAIWKKLISII